MQRRGATKGSNILKTTTSAFTAQKINIEMVVGDNKFEAPCEALIPVHVKIVGVDEHKVHVERLIRTVNESTICDFQNIPDNKCPKLMVVSYLESNITCMNVFPKKSGISKTLSPSAIVFGTPNIYATHAALQPVSYVHWKVKTRSTNNIKTRSVAVIVLNRSN